MNYLKTEINFKENSIKQLLYFSKHLTWIIVLLITSLGNGFSMEDCDGNGLENVNCEYQNEEIKSSVVHLYIDPVDLPYIKCTGTLINNSQEDKTPYIITARHCVCGMEIGESAPDTRVVFNKDKECESDEQETEFDELSGVTLLAFDDNTDLALLQISESIPNSINTYFAGWDRSNSVPQSSYSIHHPSITGTDYKMYTEDYDPAILYNGSAGIDISNCGEEYTLESTQFFKVDFDIGIILSGSSGGPLFNQNDDLIGVLYGRAESGMCASHYGRIESAWSELSPYLCPSGDCPTVMSGMSSSDSNNPDIFISNQAVSNINPSEGDDIVISCTQNVANATVNQLSPYPDVKFYVSDDLVVDGSDKYLGSEFSTIGTSDPNDNEKRTLTVTSSWGSGSKYILFVADANQEHTESNENNNLEYVQINIQGDEPDIFITKTYVSDPSPCIGQSIKISCVQNVSNATVSFLSPYPYLKFYVSDDTILDNSDIYLGRELSTIGTSDVNDYESRNPTVKSSWGTGVKYILFVADAFNTHNESNENNNIGFAQVNVSNCRLPYGEQAVQKLEVLSLQATPNYFKDFTNISYQIDEESDVSIEIYDVSGKKVASLITKELQQKGNYTIPFEAPQSLKSGIYICTIQANEKQESVKMMIQR